LPHDPFGVKIEEEQKNGSESGPSADQLLTEEATKMQLQQMYQELEEEFAVLRAKVSILIK